MQGPARTIVVKVGTSTLTDASGALDVEFLRSLSGQLCDLLDEGRRVVLVTSGAVRAGVEALGWTHRPRKIALRQAAAAVGQGRLMALYSAALASRGRVAGQILLTRQLAEDRVTYVNARNTLAALLENGALPIVNENDTVAVEELQFGDNDTLAALVGALVDADLLVLLTNVDGLLDETGAPVRRVVRLDEGVRRLAGGAGTHGSGGMVTKLQAAEIAGAAGMRTVIARGRQEGVLRSVLEERPIGTCFEPGARRLKGRKHWLAYGPRPAGALVTNERARRAVTEGGSLLPAGVIGVQGPFGEGDVVRLLDGEGEEYGRGLAACDWRDAERVQGAQSVDVPGLLGRDGLVELVHRDNLVVLTES